MQWSIAYDLRVGASVRSVSVVGTLNTCHLINLLLFIKLEAKGFLAGIRTSVRVVMVPSNRQSV